MSDVLAATQAELAKVSATLKTVTTQHQQALAGIQANNQALQDELAKRPPAAADGTGFTVPVTSANFLEALQQQTATAAELLPSDTYKQVADKTFKANKLTPLTGTQWMAASSSVFLQPFAYPRILAEGDPGVAAGFIVSGLRAEFANVSYDLCTDLCAVIMGMPATVADYVKAKKSPQEQMELLMATLLSCQRKIAMLTERRSTRTKGRGGGGGGRSRYHGRPNKRGNFDDYRHDHDGKEATQGETDGRGADRGGRGGRGGRGKRGR